MTIEPVGIANIRHNQMLMKTVSESIPDLQRAHAQSIAELLAALAVDPAHGLEQKQVHARLRRHGPNRLAEARPRSPWTILFDQFRSLIVLLLAAALAASIASRDWPEAAAIGVVILINAAIGFVSELRAVRSMEALRRLGHANATVRRDGTLQRVDAEVLVPGDIVVLEGGDVVTSDVRLIEASKLQTDESTLTGESMPVDKQPQPLPADTLVADRSNMLFKGTAVTRGSALGVVAATGMATELGRISRLVEKGLDRGKTPLERRLDQLGRSLVWITLGLTALVAVAGILSGRPPLLLVKTSIALAVAAIPEGLPIVATLALARGMWRMAKRNALIRRLSAVETLGATTVICADKTGTLTENRMTVVRASTANGDIEVASAADRPRFSHEGLRHRGVLGSAAACAAPGVRSLQQHRAAAKPGATRRRSHGACPAGRRDRRRLRSSSAARAPARTARGLVRSRSQDDGHLPSRRRASARPREGSAGGCDRRLHARAPGAESLGLGSDARAAWLARNDALAAEGLRVLALAEKEAASEQADPYEGLTVLGLLGLVDPPRSDVAASIAACRSAGVRVVMLTGDQAPTARYVARRLGLCAGDEPILTGSDLKHLAGAPEGEAARLLRAPVFSRVSPQQKLDLIQLYQGQGEIVAMTGDGVNDAPALKSADIGIAMGERGTDVAREASDMVLRDDAFASIVAAIEQGRIIFSNIRAFIRYLISCNISEILVVFLAAVANLPLPMLPLQILFLNLVTDVFPALALGAGEGEAGAMRRPPRDPKEPVLTRRHWIGIAAHGLLLSAAVLGALLAASFWLDLGEPRSVTISFLTLAFAQLWHVFNIRDADSGVFLNEVTRNPYVWGALALCTSLILLAIHVRPVAAVMQIADPGLIGWTLVIGFSFGSLLVGQAALLVLRAGSADRTVTPPAASRVGDAAPARRSADAGKARRLDQTASAPSPGSSPRPRRGSR